MAAALSADAGSRRHFLTGLVLGGALGAGAVWLWQRFGSAAPAARTPPAVPVPALDHERYMRLAIAQAQQVPELPFGAVIVAGASGEVLASGHNRSKENPTVHGEMDAINNLAAKQPPADWSGLALYTTAEPCPMCESAVAWAGIGLVVYGTSMAYLEQLGWWQIDIRAAEVIARTSFRKTALLGGVLAAECNQLFDAVPKGLYRK